MTRVVRALLGIVVLVLAGYGLVHLVAGLLTAQHGKQAVNAVHPFVQGAAGAAEEKLKENLANTPAEQLERDAQDWSKKLYPVAKGALIGQVEAFLDDPKREELPTKMREAGREVSTRIIVPFGQGLAEGSDKIVGDVEKALGKVNRLREDNKGLVDAVTSGLEAVHNKLKELPAPPPLPVPGTTPSGPQTPPSP